MLGDDTQDQYNLDPQDQGLLDEIGDKAQGETVAFNDVLADILIRDERDGARDAAPMRPADDAVLLDTSEMTIEQAADAARRIVEAARARWISSS